jgi:hypothetical protein
VREIAALAVVLLEAVGAMQNAQSNTLVAGLMIFSMVTLERRAIGTGATAIVAGASIKLFPLGAGLFGLVTRGSGLQSRRHDAPRSDFARGFAGSGWRGSLWVAAVHGPGCATVRAPFEFWPRHRRG